MANFSIKLNLAALKHSVRKMKGQSGELECLVIPIEANHLYRGEKGLYLDLTGIEVNNPRFDDTHLIKQSLPKEVYEALTDEQKKDTPIFGNMGPWKSKGEAAINYEDDESDLPF